MLNLLDREENLDFVQKKAVLFKCLMEQQTEKKKHLRQGRI